MKKIYLVFLLIPVILILVGCSSQSASTGELNGSVTWQTPGSGNATVTGATVNIWGNGNVKVASGVTDSTGHYKITNVPAGNGYMVTCYQAASGNSPEKNWLFTYINIPAGGYTQLEMTSNNAIAGATLPDIYKGISK